MVQRLCCQNRVTDSGLRILQCNLSRSRASHDEFLHHFMSHNYSVALLSEPYIGNKDSVHQIAGVSMYQFTAPRRPVKAAILVKDGCGVSLGLAQLSTPNLAVVEIGLRDRKLIIASGYVEPDDDQFNTLIQIQRLLAYSDSRLLIIGMDGNGAHYEWGCKNSDSRGDDICSLSASNNMTVINTGSHPTFEVTRNGTPCSSIVDITLASDSLTPRIRDWRVNEEACVSSDHHAVEFTIQDSGRRQTHVRESTFLFNNKTANWSKFRESLRSEMEKRQLSDSLLTPSTPSTIDSLVDAITDSCREACFTSMKLRGNQREFNPFWTPELESQKKTVIRLHHCVQQQKRRGLPTQDAAAQHQAAKKEYAKSIRKASAANFRNFCQKQGKEDVWSLTNRLLKDSPTSQPPSTLRVAAGFTESAYETATALLQHFYPDDTSDSSSTNITNSGVGSQSYPMLVMSPTSPKMKSGRALTSMNPHKAPGHDSLTSDIVTAFFDEYPALTTRVMNACLDSGHFPATWKKARVRILQKPGKEDYSQLSSFRPIGLLPVFGKLLEKLLIRRLTYAAHQD